MLSEVEEVSTASASEFLDALRTWGPEYDKEKPGALIFRGHGDFGWGLIPTAFRQKGRDFLSSLHFCPRHHSKLAKESQLYQVWIEAHALALFYSEADEVGLPIPGLNAQSMEQLNEFCVVLHDAVVAIDDRKPAEVEQIFDKAKLLWNTWPPTELLQALAISQHHGLPTRLLDWTLDSRVAAYFSAESHIDILESGSTAKPEKLCVWVAYRDRRRRPILEDNDSVTVDVPRIAFMPGAGNDFLVSQLGRLSYDRIDLSQLDSAGNCLPIDERPEVERGKAFERLRKVTLPTRAVDELLWQLAKCGICASKMYPNYAGTMRSLKHCVRLMPKWRMR